VQAFRTSEVRVTPNHSTITADGKPSFVNNMNVTVMTIIIKQVLYSLLPNGLEVWAEITIFAVITPNINILPLLYFSVSSAFT